MYERFIVLSGSYQGHWGTASTLSKAKQKWTEAGGESNDPVVVHRFTSDKPFAPTNRDATDEESDCWVTESGSINWIRCDRKMISKSEPAPKKKDRGRIPATDSIPCPNAEEWDSRDELSRLNIHNTRM